MIVQDKSELVFETRHLYKLFNPDFIQLLVKYNVLLAGGTIRSIFAREKISDFDLYFESYDIISQFEYLFSLPKTIKLVSTTDQAKTYRNTETKDIYQLITKLTGTEKNIINNFDFTVCMAGYNFKSQKWFMDENFFRDLAARRIRLNSNIPYPFATLYRAFKYQSKGYYISPSEIVKLVIKCNQIKCRSIYDWKEQLMGIDTIFLNALFKDIENKNPEVVEGEFLINSINEYLYSKDLEDN